MYTEKRDYSMIKETLKSLCCSNGWCYGIFWGFDQRNSLLLTLKDAYYEEQMGALIDNMLLQVHVLGGGVIGQAAFSKKHRWMCSDAHPERQNSLGSFETLEVFQDDSEFYWQFSTGIKTIAIISVEPWGVVQLGSTKKIPEMKDFVDQVKEHFSHKLELSENEPSSSDSQFFYSGAQFSSLLSCGISPSANQNFQHSADLEGFMEANHSLVIPSQSFPPTFAASSLIENKLQIGGTSAAQLEQLHLESGSFFDCAATQALSNNSDYSVLTSSWPHFPSVLRQNVPFSKPSSYESCTNSSLSVHVNSVTTSLQAQQFSKDNDCEAQRPSGLLTLDELFQESAVAEAPSKPCPMDDLSQWFSPLPCPSNTSYTTLLSNDRLHAAGLIPVPNLSGQNSPINISENLPANSLQSSISDAFRSNYEDKCSDTSGIDKLFNNLGAGPGCEKPQSWNSTLIPVMNGDNFTFSTVASGCISETYVGSKVGTSNSLFSKLGLDQLLDGIASSSCSFAKSGFEDQSSSAAKRRKIDNYSWSHDQIKIQGLPNFDGRKKSLNSFSDPEIRNIIELNSEASTKEPGLCIGDGSSMDAGHTSSSKRHEEPAKTGKKKAKPGTRPRPKDRQMIQDRLAELRELIPNGEKMSIDRLLERTVRHLSFMNSLTKHAENLKEINKTKSGTAQKGHSSNGGGGVTWACEVGDQTMVCPLIVEDLSTPGQMLIEILCEEQGFFLEIVDIIRGFGLIILKGVMEVRETKIWAHFIVEAKGNRHATRQEIFSSLIQLLQMTGRSVANTNDHFGNVLSSGTSLFNNCQSAVSFPVNLSDTVRCTSS
ncbi:hypothetical protein Pfo_025777 [Paulownia fortunei]|nr:hypothetical protein Pfo_025777 [Paulownia fortunei]